MDTFTPFDDSPATTAPAALSADAAPQSSAVTIKTYKIGNHRGNGRIFLEGNLIKSVGFDCGTEYTRVDNRADGVIKLCAKRVSGLPVRRVTQAMRNGKARPIIDLSDTTIRERFAGFSRVEVEFHKPQPQSNYATCGRLVIRGAK